MAHATALGLMLDGLVTSITGLDPNDQPFTKLRDKAGRALKDQSNARTNQFAVKASYAGLVEKFEVVNRDALALALQSRLDELPTKETKFMPEILSLLLQLSDRPAEKTEHDCLERFAGSEIEALTWTSLLADASASDNGLWDDIERGYHSSGDEATQFDENDADHTNSTQATSLGDEDFISLTRQHVLPVDDSLLSGVRLANDQMHRSNDGNTIVSQLVLSREILTMLHGLPTIIFNKNAETGKITINKPHTLATASKTTVSAILAQCVELGSKLNAVRLWSRAVEDIDWIQSIQASIQKIFLNFDNDLTLIEGKYLNPTATASVSLIELWAKVGVFASPLSHLSTALEYCTLGTAKQNELYPFALLEKLYEGVCLMQLAGDLRTFQVLSAVFTTGLDTYLRPVGKWVRQGLLPGADREHFLVHDLGADCTLADVWYKRYQLCSMSQRKKTVPSFMHPFIEQIFATGKTEAFLKLLDHKSECADAEALETDENCLVMNAQHSIELLLPYPDFLAEQIHDWLSQTAVNSTPNLRNRLYSEHGLGDAIKTLEYVYFAKDASLFNIFADSLTTRISNSHQTPGSSHMSRNSWKNTFMLSELAQHTLGTSAFVDAASLSIGRLEHDYSRNASPDIFVTRELSTVTLDYHFSWPIQNITRERSSSVHQRALTFLLQIHYAEARLSAQLLDLRLLNKKELSHARSIEMGLMLRQRLLWFLEVLHDHVTTSSTVRHTAMANQMVVAEGIDNMAAIWADYTKHLEISLLIADKLAPLRNTVIKIIELCEQFADLWTQLVTAKQLHQTEAEMNEGVKQQNVRTIKTLQDQFDSSFYFVVAGLRSIGRAGGDSTLEMLAQRMDSKNG